MAGAEPLGWGRHVGMDIGRLGAGHAVGGCLRSGKYDGVLFTDGAWYVNPVCGINARQSGGSSLNVDLCQGLRTGRIESYKLQFANCQVAQRGPLLRSQSRADHRGVL